MTCKGKARYKNRCCSVKVFSLLLMSTCTDIVSMIIFTGASKGENQKSQQWHQHFVFWRALWVIGLSVSTCWRLKQWRPWSWLKVGAIRRLLNSLWQAGVLQVPQSLLLQWGRDCRCHCYLDCVWQEQLYRRMNKTPQNQWAQVCCSLKADLITAACGFTRENNNQLPRTSFSTTKDEAIWVVEFQSHKQQPKQLHATVSTEQGVKIMVQDNTKSLWKQVNGC